MKAWLFSGNIDRSLFLSVLGSLVLILAQVAFIWQAKEDFPLVMPFWFARPWGEARLAEPQLLWLLPLLGLTTLFVNGALSLVFIGREKLLVKVLLLGSLVTNFLLFYTLLKLVLLIS